LLRSNASMMAAKSVHADDHSTPSAIMIALLSW